MATAQREKITFRPGQRIRAVLDQNEGKQVQGNRGPQFMRVCDADQRIMFVEPELEKAIIESGAVAGDAIQITQIGSGAKATWDVAIVCDTRITQPRLTPLPAAPTSKPAPQPIITAASAELTAALKASIDAAIEAERYAAMQSHPITFSTADIRAMANTLAIGAREGGR